MGFFITALIWSAVFVVAELIRPKPKIENARPLGLGDFSFPTATEGRAVPLVWGTVRITAPNVTWYGGLTAEAQREKIKTGMFSSVWQTTGHKYFLGMQLALCRGPIDELAGIRINDRSASSGRVGEGGLMITAPYVLGGSRGAGGITGSGTLYVGNDTQAANAYLTNETGKAIGYRGTCYYVFEGGYMGTAPNVPPWSFDVVRLPDGLDMASYDPGSESVNTGFDCNLMNVVYEIMTDLDWGLGIASNKIDLANFRETGSTLASEGNGFSMVLDGEREASDLLSEIMRQADGSLYFDRATGLWKVILARDTYSIPGLDIFDEDNISELLDFSRTTWQETTNQVRVSFVDRADGYKETFALAQDMANTIMQQSTVSVDVSYPGVKNVTLANQIAWRELSTLTYPLAKINFVINRLGFDLVPGSVFKFSWGRLGISEVIFRLSRVDYGNIDDGKITVYAVQDVFATGEGLFDDPPASGWTDVVEDAIVITSDDVVVFEAPGQMVMADPDNPDTNPRIWVGSRDDTTTGDGTRIEQGFMLHSEFAINPGSLAGVLTEDAEISSVLRSGLVRVAFDAYGSSDVRPATDYVIEIDKDDDPLSTLEVDDNSTAVSSLTNIVLIGTEFIGYEQFYNASFEVWELQRIYRGLFDSAPQPHAIGDRVWFLGQTGGGLTSRAVPDGYTGAQVSLYRININGVPASSAPLIEIAGGLKYSHTCPLPPRDPVLNGSYAPTSSSVDTDYSTETSIGGWAENAFGISAQVTPRSWREANVILDHIYDETAPDDSVEFEFKIILDPDGTPIDTDTYSFIGTGDKIVYLLRTSMIAAAGVGNAIPSTGRLIVAVKHTPNGGSLKYSTQYMELDFTITSSIQSDDHLFGGLLVNTDSNIVTVGETATFTFNIGSALPNSGIVGIQVNSGGWNTLIGIGASSNTIALTSADDIQLRFDQNPTDDRFLKITSTGSETGHCVLLAL